MTQVPVVGIGTSALAPPPPNFPPPGFNVDVVLVFFDQHHSSNASSIRSSFFLDIESTAAFEVASAIK